MNYKDALEYIHGSKKFGVKLGLENIIKLLDLLQNPHKKLKIIHVAGTNGKGSTSSYLSNMLIEEGYKVGLFTSPYLEVFNERIRINNELIPNEKLATITNEVKSKVDKMVSLGYNHPTEFEIVTAIAFKYYLDEEVDYVVLEVGLGGRYDSTNVVDKPLACVITPIDMDHMNILGDTLEKIASEKGGIIKEKSLVVSHFQKEEAKSVLEDITKDKNGEIIFLDSENFNIKECNEYGNIFDYNFENTIFSDLKISLVGKHQVNNASLAITTLIKLRNKELIKISDKSIKVGLEKTRWAGRLEIIDNNPIFVIDGAHNLHGAQALKETIISSFNYDKLILGIGMLGDKDVDNVVKLLAPLAHKIVVTEAKVPRALSASELSQKISKYNDNVVIKENISDAVNEAKNISNKNDLIVFSGSLYIIGDVRKLIKKN